MNLTSMICKWSKCMPKGSYAGSLLHSVVIWVGGETHGMCDLSGSHWDHCPQKGLMLFSWQPSLFPRKQAVTERSSLAS